MLRQPPNSRIKRVDLELRAAGIRPSQSENPLRSGVHTRGYLPHVKREGARYFVTFRLADSLPKDVLLRIQSERTQDLRECYTQQEAAKNDSRANGSADRLRQIQREYFQKLERYLDEGQGQCYLARRDVAALVADALRFFDHQRYELNAWVLMPNHVHIVLWPIPNHTLSEVLQSWKGFTARQANKLLGRAGVRFWQPETFDHWIRDDEEHERCCRYVIHNPVKARLCLNPAEWQWSSAWRDCTLHSTD